MATELRQPIRVLQIVGCMGRGGFENMIMNIYRHIDREKVQFDFLAHYGKEAAFNDEIRALGGRIFEMPRLKDEEQHVYYGQIFSYIKALNDFFGQHPEYKIIHGHMTNTAAIYMPIARKYGVTCRISHSHSTHGKKGTLGIVTNILQKPIALYATDYFACSQVAAHWFYTQRQIESGRVRIIPNAIDAGKFRFDKETRISMRSKLHIEQEIVVGCVAGFRAEKNQQFLLAVLCAIKEKGQLCKLLFVGDGPCENAVKLKATEKNISNDILFMGQRTDVSDLMQAMDVFVLPSLWEGLPLVGVEAQASGLPCVVSDAVTSEMNILGEVQYLSLDDDFEKWANIIIEAARKPRTDRCEEIKQKGYDVATTAKWLQNFYLSKGEI